MTRYTFSFHCNKKNKASDYVVVETISSIVGGAGNFVLQNYQPQINNKCL